MGEHPDSNDTSPPAPEPADAVTTPPAVPDAGADAGSDTDADAGADAGSDAGSDTGPGIGMPDAVKQPAPGAPAAEPQPSGAAPQYPTPQYPAPPYPTSQFPTSQYPAPPFPAPPYGQAPSGMPPSGIPPYGTPPYGTPPYGAPQYGGAQYPPPAYAQGYPPPLTQQTNTLAIVSLVSAFIVNVVGIVTGHMALSQIKRTGEKGRGLAVGGLIVGYVSLAATIIGGILFAIAIGLAIEEENAGYDTGYDTGYDASYGVPVQVPEHANAFGGITFGADGALVPPVEAAPLDTWGLPTGADVDLDPYDPMSLGLVPSAASDPVAVVVYVDFMCPHCADFEQTQGPLLTTLADAGAITVEYRPVAFMDRFSNGTDFSSRSAAAAACVAATAPGAYNGFLDGIFAEQPQQNSDGLSNARLSELGSAAGAEIAGCVDDGRFLPYVEAVTSAADNIGVYGTPSVYADGELWEADSLTAFLQAAVDAKLGVQERA